MIELHVFANSGDPDQTPRSAASDLRLHCLPITFLGVSRLQWGNTDIGPLIYVHTTVQRWEPEKLFWRTFLMANKRTGPKSVTVCPTR